MGEHSRANPFQRHHQHLSELRESIKGRQQLVQTSNVGDCNEDDEAADPECPDVFGAMYSLFAAHDIIAS
jgi:hypothetical protein